jgi:hypothetical protein
VRRDSTAQRTTDSDIALLRQEFKHYREAIKSENELLLASMTIRFGLMLIGALGFLFVALAASLR